MKNVNLIHHIFHDKNEEYDIYMTFNDIRKYDAVIAH